MNTKRTKGTSEQELSALETQVTALIESCGHLKEENQHLRTSQADLKSERSTLLGKNEQAKTRVDAMITRLKSLEAKS